MMMMAMMPRRRDKEWKRQYVVRHTEWHESAVSTGSVIHNYLIVFAHCNYNMCPHDNINCLFFANGFFAAIFPLLSSASI